MGWWCCRFCEFLLNCVGVLSGGLFLFIGVLITF